MTVGSARAPGRYACIHVHAIPTACGWTGGAMVGLHTNPLDIPQSSQRDTALPIQHVQPSTCADTINQIN
ncbi:hypothetical protein ALC57_01732 [Trachymyrmex cornetzi]|uniref:Uncharacterized protein n=1 Tax=Trachymyrmex cornetzi TaxID=471704 RepID=A0A195ELL3_9HYME|nr:hypothetical protein ALC57_01732 [Trachymyrmex cornetzi]